MEKLKIKVIVGSVRKGRFSDKTTKWVMDCMEKKAEFETELLDLKNYPMPFYEDEITPGYVKEGNYADPVAKKFALKIKEADGFIIITPEYNHGIPGVLKNAMDHVYSEWNNKPIAFVSHGSAAGGSRSVEHLRLVAVELQMAPIRQGVHISNFWTQVDEKGNLKTEPFQPAMDTMLKQLEWWVKALKNAREKS